MRREFVLPEEDVDYLDALGLPWETVVQGGVNWLLVHNHKIPAGYNVAEATVGIRIEATYPTGLLDMAYFYPPLARTDGQPVNNLTPLTVDGKTFQQWSRHYTWVAGEHSLITHMGCVTHWLTGEFSKR